MKLTQDFSKELKQIRQSLGAQFAIISHIDGTDYRVLAVSSDLEMISEGDQFETKNTYCNEVINSQNMVHYEHVGSMDEMVHHPIYTAVQLESYIGEPLCKNGKIVGTLNFSSFNRKHPTFSEHEINSVKALARQVEKALQE